MPRTRSQALGSGIAQARWERGITQGELATASGVGLETLRKLEQGHVEQPGVFRIAAIADALEMAVDSLLPARPHPVSSVGYEGCDIASFVDAIQAANVDLVADVRLTPLSRKQGFSKARLDSALGEIGVRYEHLRSLGNAKENRPLFAGAELEVGRARYRAGLRTPEAKRALDELASWRQEHHVVLLCFERDERRCHRSVVLEELAQLG
ncbi:DUF488 family protein [Phycicoccus endophyticus]|uniref:DUF488 family protein n=1 Tax=Phycicoccus endophyticus TaxID=1690220 RepID=A0A7G9R658_9MICO|nr:DUF488 family protein [Phycicoccus endophyticus]NHI19447.1 DUF488 family protein [Phycicoccus endophyticus]QNN51083.1 DUF488 family protein [Phycicoccus endophyticus]